MNLNILVSPYLAVYLTDMRGINETPQLLLNREAVVLEPIQGLNGYSGGLGLNLPEVISQYKNETLQSIKFGSSLNRVGRIFN